AFILMLIVLVLPGILFPPKKTANRRALKDSLSGGQAVGDTSRAADTARTAPPPAALTAVASPFVCPAATDRESSRARSSGVAAETVWVSSPRARFGFSTAGAQLVSAELLDYTSFAPGDAERPVQLVGMGHGLRSVEADTMDDFRHLAVVTKAAKTQSLAFQSLKPGAVKVLDGPFEWAGVKSKYFLAAALELEDNQPRFGGGIAVGGPVTVTTSSFFGGTSGVATRTALTLTLPVPPGGDFRYDLYTGPLEYRQLARLGHDLDDANPYGGVLRPLIQPVSILVVNILIWMHDRLSLAYGWVLVIFGILVRGLLWPLNQKAM